MASLHPYINFNGNCEEAFNFYKSVFGGEFQHIGRYSEMPAEYGIAEADSNLIMHVSLPISKNSVLMGCDTSSTFGVTAQPGSSITISINADSEEEATDLFNKISAGGNVTMPLEKTFWGALFGMCTDKFGINWMVNFDYVQQEQ